MNVSSEVDVPARGVPPVADAPIADPDNPTAPNPHGSPTKWVTIVTGIVGVLVFLRGCGAVIQLSSNFIDYVTK